MVSFNLVARKVVVSHGEWPPDAAQEKAVGHSSNTQLSVFSRVFSLESWSPRVVVGGQVALSKDQLAMSCQRRKSEGGRVQLRRSAK